MANDDDNAQAEIDEASKLIGEIIILWINIEYALGEVLAEVIKPKNLNAFYAAFYDVFSPRQKLTMTNSAVSYAFHNDENINKQWKSIYNAIKSTLYSRNNLAHFNGVLYPAAGYFIQPTPENVAVLVKAKMNPNGISRYTVKDLYQIKENSHDTYTRIVKFRFDYLFQKEPPQESGEMHQ